MTSSRKFCIWQARITFLLALNFLSFSNLKSYESIFMRLPPNYQFLLNMRLFANRPSDVEARASFGSKTQGAGLSSTNQPGIPLQTTPNPSPAGASSGPPSTPIASQKLSEFLEKYDPRPRDLPSLYPMSEHRAMMRTMFLDNILFNTARLHKHNWILLSQNEKYKERLFPLSLFHSLLHLPSTLC